MSFQSQQSTWPIFSWRNLVRRWLQLSITHGIPFPALRHTNLEWKKFRRQNVRAKSHKGNGSASDTLLGNPVVKRQQQSSESRAISWMHRFIFFNNSSHLTQSTCSEILFNYLDWGTIRVKRNGRATRLNALNLCFWLVFFWKKKRFMNPIILYELNDIKKIWVLVFAKPCPWLYEGQIKKTGRLERKS